LKTNVLKTNVLKTNVLKTNVLKTNVSSFALEKLVKRVVKTDVWLT